MNAEIKKKLDRIASLERKHGVIGVSLNAVDTAPVERVLDYVADMIEDSSRLIKGKRSWIKM